MEKGFVSGAELKKLADHHVSDKLLEKTLTDKTFREFCRILIFMQLSSSELETDQSFGHSFIIRKNNKDMVDLQTSIQIKPVKMNKM